MITGEPNVDVFVLDVKIIIIVFNITTDFITSLVTVTKLMQTCHVYLMEYIILKDFIVLVPFFKPTYPQESWEDP